MEESAREASLRESPGQSAYSLGARPQRARDDRRKAMAKVETLEAEITTLQAIEHEYADEEGLIAHEERRARLRSLRAGEKQAIKRAGELVEQLVEIYGDYVLAVQGVDRLGHSAFLVFQIACLRARKRRTLPRSTRTLPSDEAILRAQPIVAALQASALRGL